MSEYKPVKEGECVVFVDPHGRQHMALVTCVHGQSTLEERNERYRTQHAEAEQTGQSWATDEWLERLLSAPFVVPSLNVVWVSDEKDQKDSYGQQIVRSTSVPHKQSQAAHGFYWTNA